MTFLRSSFALGALLAVCHLAEGATATQLQMVGTLGYSVSGQEVTLEVERIENLSRDRTSGTLYLTMWLTAGADPYTTGHVAGRASLSATGTYGNGTLGPGQSFHDVSLTMPYLEPPPGTYYIHLYVSEWPELDTTLDIFTFTNPFTVEPESFSRIHLAGTVSYLISGGEVTLEVEQISNDSHNRTSGTLYLTLWLTAGVDPHTTGHIAGRASLAGQYGDGRLAPDERFNNVKLTMPYTEPPLGSHYVHIYVSEHPDLNTVLDFVTFTHPFEQAQDDHGDKASEATPVLVRSSTEGELQWRGDVDVFRVRVAHSGRLRVETIGTTDTRGALSDQGNTIVATDDDGGDLLNFRIEKSVGPGDWYITVRGFGRSTVGAYVLKVEFERDATAPEGARGMSIAGGHLGDFNGDGRADVLLRRTDGRWHLYPMAGKQVGPGRGTVRLTEDLDYRMAGIGDFNGDGRDDVLLRRRDGIWHYYPMDGRRVLADSGRAAITTDTAYRVAGVGDFNGDGHDDVLLRHNDGRWRYVPMNGRLVVEAQAGAANLTPNVDFKVAGIGDFNGDGRDDVLLRHSDGRWHYYPMNGARSVSGRGSVALTRDLDYAVAGIGDFDGDGRGDIMLRHTDGRWHYYRMDGRQVLAGSGSASLTKNTDYRVAGIGDMDGDGRDDLLLRHASGRWYFYPMNGRRPGSGRGTANLTPNLEWAIPGPPTEERTQAAGTIYGTLAVAPGQVLDSDTPDANNPRVSNDTVAFAQRIPVPVSVAGHASDTDDTHDTYLLTLPAATRISLAIADTDADLDLHLADTDGTIIAESLGVDDLEAIHTHRTGDHILTVSAWSGASNYTLVASIDQRVASADSVHVTDASTATYSSDGAFVPGELIVHAPRLPGAAPGNADIVALRAGAMDELMRMGLVPEAATPSGEVLVRIDASPRPTPSVKALESAGLRYGDDAVRARGMTLRSHKQLAQGNRFDAVHPNYIYQTMAEPNDPYYRHQWHYPFIGLPQAWDITTGDNDVVVAVIDTGVVTDHPDLAARMMRDARNRPVGFDFIADPHMADDGDGIDADPYDAGDGDSVGTSSFHGTHVAGTIGADTNNADGVAGVMWHGSILPIRVLGRGGKGSINDIAQGIRYAAGLANVSGTVPPKRADVINLSLGTPNEDCGPYPPVDTATRTAIEDAIGTGAIVVVAAGNDNCHWPDPMTTIEGVVSVGATDQGGRAPYSNFGAELDVVAPGGNMDAHADGDAWPDGVLSASAEDSEGETKSSYVFSEGTSMAAPHVAGVFGLMLSVNPDLEPTDINHLLAGTHPDTAARITRDWGDPGRDDQFGYGLIDASRAVRVARAIEGGGADDPPDRPVLAVAPTSLYFDTTATVLRMELSNAGAGPLSIRSVEPNSAWMNVTIEWPSAQENTVFPASNAVVVVNVDRTGLTEGTFVGSIQIDSDGGSLRVPVTLRVQRSVTSSDVGTVYVLALEPSTYELHEQAITSTREGYAFTFPALPAGQYVIAAGTDRDDDGYICDAGEACGVWPLRDSPGIVDVDGDQRVDFGVSIDLFASVVSQSARPSLVAPSGFRRDAMPERSAGAAQ